MFSKAIRWELASLSFKKSSEDGLNHRGDSTLHGFFLKKLADVNVVIVIQNEKPMKHLSYQSKTFPKQKHNDPMWVTPGEMSWTCIKDVMPQNPALLGKLFFKIPQKIL